MTYIQLVSIGIAHYFLHEYDAAVHATKSAIQTYPDHHLALRWLAAALAQAGRLAEAQQILRKTLDMSRASSEIYVHQRAPWYRPEDHEHMLDGLRKAGWNG
jgi:adenylate cyclase